MRNEDRELKRFQVLSIPEKRYTTIHCYKGAIWLTAGQGFDDTILQAGQHLTLLNHGHIVVEALEDSSVVFSHAVASAMPELMTN